MKNFEKQSLPWEVFGAGCTKEIGTRLQAREIKTILVVTDKGIVNAGIVAPILRDLQNFGIDYSVYDKCEPNCPDYTVLELGRIIKDTKVDAVLAIGGGSSMDAARGGAMVAGIPEEITDLLEYGGTGTKMKPTYKPACQVITVATTHATASEASRSSVVLDSKRHIKFSFLSPNMTPDLAFTDPELTLGMPALPTAITGMDAMAHPLEGLLGPDPNSVSEILCLESVKKVWQWLPIAVAEPRNLEARSHLMWAALQGNTNGGTPPGHAIAHAIGSVYGLVHGHACCVVLPALIRHHAETSADMIKKVADIMGIPTTEDNITIANRVAERLKKFYTELGIVSLQEALKEKGIEVTEEQFAKDLREPILVDYKARAWRPAIHRDEDMETYKKLMLDIFNN